MHRWSLWFPRYWGSGLWRRVPQEKFVDSFWRNWAKLTELSPSPVPVRMFVAWRMQGVDLSLEFPVVGRGIVTQLLWKGYPQDNLLISSLAFLTLTARIESLRFAVFSPGVDWESPVCRVLWEACHHVDGLKGSGLRTRRTYLDMLYFLKRQVLTDQVSQSILILQSLWNPNVWMTIKSGWL